MQSSTNIFTAGVVKPFMAARILIDLSKVHVLETRSDFPGLLIVRIPRSFEELALFGIDAVFRLRPGAVYLLQYDGMTYRVEKAVDTPLGFEVRCAEMIEGI
jgi:hypothetical protein